MPLAPVITLTTDFGTADGYVAEVKGVLVSSAPGVQIIDLTHDIPPQDVDAARLALARAWRRFPEGTIHVVVVDPGVGSRRAAIAVRSHGRYLLGPDNGVLSPALLAGDAVAVSLAIPPQASPTFHGRDVFAPAAAKIAMGASMESLGPIKSECIIRRTPPTVRRDDGCVAGEIIAVDRFGNIVTNVMTRAGGTIALAGRDVAILRTYADVGEGVLVAVVGSSGFIEVAIRNGSAAGLLGVRRGDPVVWKPALQKS